MLESPVGISVPLAICLGLLASFIQSLGLTIQRKAHIQNESIPITKRKSVWRMPLFLIGFIIFISANIGGTIFQIGALPLTILAPLGAVSLLFNALLARVLLNGLLSFYMVSGTVLISLGAVLIGYFGAVQETQHSLDELLSLYSRPAFVAFATIAFLVFVGVLAIAHLAEWQLQASLWRSSNPILNSPNLKKKKKKSQPLRRRWSAPSLAPVVEVNESTSGIATPILDLVDEANRRGVPADKLIEAAKQREKENQLKETKKKGVTNQDVSKSTTLPRRKDYGTLSSIKTSNSNTSSNQSTPSSPSTPRIANRAANGSTSIPGPLRRNSEPPTLNAQDSASCSLEESVIRRTQLGLAVAYGAASGTLSGVCLLLAKSGVELLVLTFSGQNQFGRWQSWALVLIMLMAALLQLWYLNKSLKLADPTLVCPLAFCFYNTSSIALGLVYFNQLDSLAWYSVVLVVLGTAILLSGVWIVSLHGSSSSEDDESIEEEPTTMSIIQSPISTTSPINGSSGIETSDATETSALLANAAGIVGPHLPPPTSPEQPLESGATSPTTPLSPRKKRNRSHSRTGSIRLFSGSGIESDSSPFYNKDEDEEDLEISTNDSNQPQYATINSNPKESRMKVYTSLLERGLSIGISPSSPGFLLSGSNEGPSSPGGTQRSYSSGRKFSRRERQTFSESDVETLENPSIENVLGLSRNEEEESQSQLTTSNSNETIRESQNQMQGVNQDRLETGYSRFNRIPGIDVGALTERLGRLGGGGTRTNGGEERGGLLSWIPTFGFGRNGNGSANGVTGDGNIEERRSLLEQEEGNARPREPPWAGTRRR